MIITTLSTINYLPDFPDDYKPKIGIIGVGNIVRNQHLPAYAKYDVQLGGIFDISQTAIGEASAHFDVGHVYSSVEAMLNDEAIEVVDIATHPVARFDIILQALEAGKHVLSQKPLALSAALAQQLIDKARSKGLWLAVNQNGRWTPPWRIATRLIEQGVIGDVIAITHLFDTNFSWLTGTVFDGVKHWLFYDYGIHWFDITRCWMGNIAIRNIRAREYRTPNQHSTGKAPWAGWAEIEYVNGVNAMIRSVGGASSVVDGHPFWVHGTKGTIYGSVLLNERITLEIDGSIIHYQPQGNWFPDGFAGAMGELLCAIDENREPYHSAAHNLLTLQMTMAACRSSELDGRAVEPMNLDYSFA